MSRKHLPCPFCGSTNLKPVGTNGKWDEAQIQCQRCGAEGPRVERSVDTDSLSAPRTKVAIAWRWWDSRTLY